MEIVKRLPLYRSNAVADKNAHKLYWIDILVDENNRFVVKSYAQLFTRSGNEIRPGSVREYIIHKGKFFGESIKYALDKLNMKERARGYRKISDREEVNVTASEETIIQFLLKYG